MDFPAIDPAIEAGVRDGARQRFRDYLDNLFRQIYQWVQSRAVFEPGVFEPTADRLFNDFHAEVENGALYDFLRKGQARNRAAHPVGSSVSSSDPSLVCDVVQLNTVRRELTDQAEEERSHGEAVRQAAFLLREYPLKFPPPGDDGVAPGRMGQLSAGAYRQIETVARELIDQGHQERDHAEAVRVAAELVARRLEEMAAAARAEGETKHVADGKWPVMS
jgi:hypothetical protein